MTDHPHRIDRQVVYGLIFLLILGLLVAGTVARYQGVFEDTVKISVDADRAGLTMAPGAPVKLRGVEIGTVESIETDGDRVDVQLEIDADKLERVPADVTARIVPPTAFGAKYVELVPGAEGGPAIEAGAVVPATRVTVEVDEAFVNLTRVLDVARPAEVSSALTAAAGAVDQRGEVIGQLITQTDAYLRSFNPALPTLSEDLRTADDVLDVYEAARPDLVATLSQTGEISDTLVRQQASLRAFERSLTSFSNEADLLLTRSGRSLTTTLQLLAPVAEVLERYSPELPCTVLGLASANTLAENAVGGTHPGVTTITRLVPGRDPYTYGQNLPQQGDDRGPQCYGLPVVDAREATAQPPAFVSGANPYYGPQPTPSEASLQTLLGLLQGATP